MRQKYTKVKGLTTRSEVEELIAQYAHFYNFERNNLKTTSLPMKSGARPHNIALFYDRSFCLCSFNQEQSIYININKIIP